MPLLGETQCAEHGQSFAETYRYQYVIAQAALDLPGMSQRVLAGVVLHVGAALPCEVLTGGDGEVVGYLFGAAAAHDGRRASEALSAEIAGAGGAVFRGVEQILPCIAGRFGVIIAQGDAVRLYLDATGMIGAVYDSKSCRVATSLGLCLDREIVPNPMCSPPAKGEKAPEPGLFHTRDAFARRLNCNHFLDLKSFETQRFWPRDTDEFHIERAAYGAAFDEIIAATQQIMRRHVEDYRVALPLSGGQDSRAILAMTEQDVSENIDQVFTYITNWINHTDAAIGNQLCALRGLGHECLNVQRKRRFGRRAKSHDQVVQFQIARCDSSRPNRDVRNGVASRIVPDAVVMRGQQVPVIRALFVDDPDEAAWTPDHVAERIMDLLGVGVLPPDQQDAFAASVRESYAELPPRARRRVLDLMLAEAVNGPELAGVFCGYVHGFFSSPFNSRRMLQLFCSFDTAFRLSRRAMALLLRRADPVLNGVALTPSVKDVRWIEDDDQMAKRERRLKRMTAAYQEIFGEAPPPVQVTRFRRGGGG